MSKKPKRDSAEDEERLKAEYPGLYVDFLAGRIPSLPRAMQMAGLTGERTRLQKLKNSWKKATDDDRRAFLSWLAETDGALVAAPAGMGPGAQAAMPPSPPPPIATGRYLLPATVERIKAIMIRRGLRPADVMAEMGFLAEDRSLTLALARNSSLRLSVIVELEKWLAVNAE
ncbi:hypothetical protein HGO38_27425 [Rhizobium sp. CG5]|uniref:hypothetical protein n=1 Tax=Rhizobium sp. CG5 TaxID=2726076 RepID=UPI002034A6DB|nr:hypothetical protein [Rhizobium sp. CG5]MCM2477188.1 hypothetical protein [Rhizobium sp. CG5]